MKTARAKIEGASYSHVMNGILERRYILKDHGQVCGPGDTLHRSFCPPAALSVRSEATFRHLPSRSPCRRAKILGGRCPLAH